MTTLNIDSARSYKTEANLDKAVAKLFPSIDYLTVCNREGRFTAIFPISWLSRTSYEGDMVTIPSAGFMITG